MGFATKTRLNSFSGCDRVREDAGALRHYLLKYWFSITDEEQQLRF